MKISVSGIRGIYGQDLNLHEISKFTRLFASSMIKSGGGCVLARDTRPSSRIIAETATATFMDEGIDVYNLEVAPTPIVFRESRKYDGGLVVTASHNPLEWNGLKFIIKGEGFSKMSWILCSTEWTYQNQTNLGNYLILSQITKMKL